MLEGDGSGLYTIQSLWTQAREQLDVVNIVFVNDIYRILQIELQRAGIERPGPQGQALTDLDQPSVDWSAIAKGFGVPGAAPTPPMVSTASSSARSPNQDRP